VVMNKGANALLRVADALQPLFKPFHNDGESVLLNQVQQLFFGFEVMIKPREGHSAGARKVAHRSAFISFSAKDTAGMFQHHGHAPVEIILRKIGLGLPPVQGKTVKKYYY